MTRTAKQGAGGHGHRRTVAAICGVTALVVIGGSVLGSTAANATTPSLYRCTTTTGTTSLVDFGTSAVRTAGNGLIGAATGADGSQVGLLSCSATSDPDSTPTTQVLSGTPTATSSSLSSDSSDSTPSTSTPTDTTTPTATATATATTTAPVTDSTTATAPAKESAASAADSTTTSLDSVRLARSAMIVYPAATGYQDSVNFSVLGLTAASSVVPITGHAVLSKGAEVVKTWAIGSSLTRITWNGRVGSKVVAGVYTLKATAWSADGMTKTSSMKVLVSAKHLVTKTVSVRTGNLAKAVTDNLPLKVARALTYGPVSLRIHTVAKVTGRANVIITIPGYGSYPVPLKNGDHVTGPIPVEPGFLTAQFSHDWKKSDAKLKNMYTVFTYKELVR